MSVTVSLHKQYLGRITKCSLKKGTRLALLYLYSPSAFSTPTVVAHCPLAPILAFRDIDTHYGIVSISQETQHQTPCSPSAPCPDASIICGRNANFAPPICDICNAASKKTLPIPVHSHPSMLRFYTFVHNVPDPEDGIVDSFGTITLVVALWGEMEAALNFETSSSILGISSGMRKGLHTTSS